MLLVTGMCLYCLLVHIVIANLASILPSSFLRNSKRAGTKAVSSRGDGKWRVGTKWGVVVKVWSCWKGEVCVSEEQGSWGFGEAR